MSLPNFCTNPDDLEQIPQSTTTEQPGLLNVDQSSSPPNISNSLKSHHTLSLSTNQRVFQIWPSGEIFSTYSDYVTSLISQKQPIWTCRYTARTRLTFQAAWDSEERAAAQIEILPEDLKEKLFKRVHMSTEPLDILAQALVEMAVAAPTVGDHVKVSIEGQPMRGKIVGIEDDSINSVQYRVELLGPLTESDAADTQDTPTLAGEVGPSGSGTLKVLNQKSLISKALAKKLIRGNAERRTTNGPWILELPLIEKYNLVKPEPSSQPIPSTTTKTLSHEQSISGQIFGKKKEPLPLYLELEYPVPDLTVPCELMQECPPWPQPKLSKVTNTMIETWGFLNAFASPLELSSFGLMDWVESLNIDADEEDNNLNIWLESILALIKPLIVIRRDMSKSAFANIVSDVTTDRPGLFFNLFPCNNDDHVKNHKHTHNGDKKRDINNTESSEISDDGVFSDQSNAYSSSKEESEDSYTPKKRRTPSRRHTKHQAPTRRSIRQLARSLPIVDIKQSSNKRKTTFDVRTLKWFDSEQVAKILHEGSQHRRRIKTFDATIGLELLTGMLVELEPTFEWAERIVQEISKICKSVKQLQDFYVKQSSDFLCSLCNLLLQLNVCLPWLRDYLDALYQSRDESRRKARDLDALRRSFKRNLNETTLHLTALNERASMNSFMTPSEKSMLAKELRATELKVNRLATQHDKTIAEIKECELQSEFERVSRLEALGKDRWQRTYWHIDGLLWVTIDKECSIDNNTEEEEKEENVDGDGDVLMTRDQEYVKKQKHDKGVRWYFYDNAEQLNNLRTYLTPFGINESELLIALEGVTLPPKTENVDTLIDDLYSDEHQEQSVSSSQQQNHQLHGDSNSSDDSVDQSLQRKRSKRIASHHVQRKITDESKKPLVYINELR